MGWQRVESATIDPDVSEGLEVRIADPYWMLARQWQAGEFRGEDAANPVLVELTAESIDIDLLRLGPPDTVGPAVERLPGGPLEPVVEAEPIIETRGRQRLAAEAAHELLAQLRSTLDATINTLLLDAFRTRYPLVIDDDGPGTDVQGRQRLELFARRSFDGIALLEEMVSAPADVLAWGSSLGLTPAQNEAVVRVLGDWVVELGQAFVNPSNGDAWNPSRMEYEFQVAASLGRTAGGVALSSRDYGGGRLDWFGFDVTGALPPLLDGDTGVVTHQSELLPQPLRYAGMPASRFWEFENGEVHFGGIDAAPEDLARTALAAYATVYGDDWYLVPLTLPAQSLVAVTNVRVIDDFGEATDIPAAAVIDGPDRSFRFFELTGDASAEIGRAPMLLLPPTVETTDAGVPIDDVRIARDETANMAWAVEHRIEGAYGHPVDPMLDPMVRSPQTTPESVADDDRWRFHLTGDVPANWVPLVPVQLGQDGQVGLQRGRMPVPGTTTTRGALGQLLEPDRQLVIEEAEVPGAGLRVVRRFQSARSADGRLHVWLGRQKGPGRPHPESGYVFDTLERPAAP